jgi:hypothetical protein
LTTELRLQIVLIESETAVVLTPECARDIVTEATNHAATIHLVTDRADSSLEFLVHETDGIVLHHDRSERSVVSQLLALEKAWTSFYKLDFPVSTDLTAHELCVNVRSPKWRAAVQWPLTRSVPD